MATKNPTVAEKAGDGSWKVFKWAQVVSSDDCTPVVVPDFADRSVQMLAGAGGWNGGSISLEGSNKPGAGAAGTDWAILTDPQGNAITKSADGLEAVTENTMLQRPRVTAGSPTGVDVYLLVRHPNDLRQ